MEKAPFHKENVYGVWSKDLFADAAIVQGQHKTLYISGMGAEDPDTGEITHLGDFSGQCQLAYQKIERILRAQGGDMNSIVRIVAYVTDIRYFADYMACQKAAFAGAPMPPHSLINVSQLAIPGMMVEVEATAAIALDPSDQ
ncbi:RidA family protein [Paludibacterium purpuratum]|uniref:Enamine deaminase RidA (YjgF/YER057c/UK114 family) n=1 Tax=Paludibacterium purpuratum TaxID=1144873 RepID=A0A4R7BFD3_9NEIS|nr:RidA family protein [Paludibacterium purpuratum]TDR82992.1 enamine deaminase RidA (YjgF/YER057c/UK114 family) [Paludibacterium purpuratum]